MKLFTLITVLLIPSIVASVKCNNPKLECIELCCEKTKVYNIDMKYCENIPASWDAFVYNETVEYVKYEGNCTKNIFASIPSCYSPYHNKESNNYNVVELTNIPCHRSEPASWHLVATVFLALVVPISLVIMAVCSSRKGKFICKLFSWYFWTTAIWVVVLVVGVCHSVLVELKDRESTFKRYFVIGEFFYISSCLWQTVVGYHMWSEFKAPNKPDTADKYRRRYVYYSIYVWGVAAILTSVSYLLSDQNLHTNFVSVTLAAISVYNLLTFLILSVNICMIRCGVVNMINKDHFKRKLSILILRLALVMGFPKMVLLLPGHLFQSAALHYVIVTFLEPFVIFIGFVWKPKFRFCWCRKTEEVANATEVVYLHTRSGQ